MSIQTLTGSPLRFMFLPLAVFPSVLYDETRDFRSEPSTTQAGRLPDS